MSCPKKMMRYRIMGLAIVMRFMMNAMQIPLYDTWNEVHLMATTHTPMEPFMLYTTVS